MKIFIALCLAIINNFLIFSSNWNPDTNCYSDSVVIYFEVDELPKFKSQGSQTIMEYIYSNIKYPSEADVSGSVIVSFVVTKHGNVEQIKIEKSLYIECDNEVKRVLLSMPKWEAGKKNNKFVGTLLLLSVKFKIR